MQHEGERAETIMDVLREKEGGEVDEGTNLFGKVLPIWISVY